jgi:predicted PurR-regulated permease PerM
MTTNQSRYSLIALALVFLGLTAMLLSSFVAPLVLGAILAAGTYPSYTKLRTALKDRENLAALLMILVIVVIILTPILTLLTLLAQEALDLFLLTQEQDNLTDNPALLLFQNLAAQLGIDAERFIQEQVLPSLKNFGLYLSSRVGSLLSDALQLFLGFFVLLVTIFYLLRDGKALGDFLMKFSPLQTKEELYIFQTFKKVGRAVFYGNFLSAMAQGALGGLGFWIFGLGSPVLWGTTMGFLGLIPLLGPYLIFIPAALYLFLAGQTGMAVGFLAYNLILVSSADNIIKPKFISEEIKIHPLLILLSILGALKIFGIIGILYGPLIVSVFFALLEIYLQSKESATATAS